MHLKKLFVFGLLAAVLPAFAEEVADRKTATSLKYVEHELDTRQDKFTAEQNKAMEYTDSAGTVQKRTVKSDLGTNTSDTSLPMVGGVNVKLATKQDDIAAVNDHTAVTYTGTAGQIGQKGIYQTSESYVEQSDNLIDAKTFNAALKRGLDSEFLCSEYKPGTDLCWVWSIHNTGDNNLFTTAGATLNKYYSESGTEGNGTYPQYGYNFAHTNFIEVQPNTTYTLSITCGGFETVTNHRVIAWDANRGFIAQIANNICSAGTTQRKSATFTTTATTKYLTINYVYDPAGENPRLELGSSETEVPFTTLVPAGYTPVEYIEGTGTQYLNTGVKYGASEHVKYNIDFKVTAFTNTGLWGGLDTTRTGAIWLNSNRFKGSMGATSSASSPIAIPFDTNKHSAVFSAGLTPSDANVNLFFDGILYSMPYIYDEMYMGTNKDIMLFYGYGYSTYQPAKMQVYKFQIYLDDELRFNGIPVKHGTTVGMYDTVSGEFLTSVPTNTNFRAGPEISNIIYVPQNQ